MSDDSTPPLPDAPEPEGRVDLEGFLDETDLSGYENSQQFAMELGAVIARAQHTDDELLDSPTVASTLERWRATMTGHVVLPVTRTPGEARKLRDEFDQLHGETVAFEVPVTEKLIHDLDSQLDHIDNLSEGDED